MSIRGRPKRETILMRACIPSELYRELLTRKPWLLKPENPKELKHGALGKYLEGLISKDLGRTDNE